MKCPYFVVKVLWSAQLTSKLLFAIVELVLFALLDGSEASQYLHELPEVDAVIIGVSDEGMHDSVAQRIDGELGNSKEIFT